MIHGSALKTLYSVKKPQSTYIYTLSLHDALPIWVVRQILQEENITLDPKALAQMWQEAEAAEEGYAQYLLKEPILGYSAQDRKSTRLNSSHVRSSYAVFCLKKKK